MTHDPSSYLDDKTRQKLFGKNGAAKKTKRSQALRVTLANRPGDSGYPAWAIIWYMPRANGKGGSGHRVYGGLKNTLIRDKFEAVTRANEYIQTRAALKGCKLEVEDVLPEKNSSNEGDPLA